MSSESGYHLQACEALTVLQVGRHALATLNAFHRIALLRLSADLLISDVENDSA